jgi:ATP-binding cassette subfamily G (WHITE) protein 2 (SNQ2)
MQMLRQFTNQHGCSTAVSLYQGSDSMVPLFDKVLVINGGPQIFYGKATGAKAYFENLGFVCPDRTTITDFLNSMTAEPELRHVRGGWKYRVPSNAVQFEEAFQKSEYYKAAMDDIAAEVREPSQLPIGAKRKVYELPLYRQILECSVRQFRILIFDTNTWVTELVTIVVQSLVLGTLFRNQARTTQSFFVLGSALFNSVLVPALQSMSEFNNSFAERPLVIRQKQYRFYRPIAYAMGLVLTDAVWKVVAIAYNIPQYFLIGFQRTASKFFTWFFIVYILHLALSMVFRAIAVSSPTMGRAVLPVGLMFNLFVLYTGLYVPGPQMQIWLFWLRYLNVSTAVNSLKTPMAALIESYKCSHFIMRTCLPWSMNWAISVIPARKTTSRLTARDTIQLRNKYVLSRVLCQDRQRCPERPSSGSSMDFTYHTCGGILASMPAFSSSSRSAPGE